MRLIDLFETEPVDLGAFRKQKASQEFHNKITNLAADMPNVFAKQEQQEAWFNEQLGEISKRMNLPLQKYKMEIRPLFIRYPHLPIFELLNLSVDMYDLNFDEDKDLKPLARRFVQQHHSEMSELLKQAKVELLELAEKADTMHWPAPWRRYTRFNSFWHDINNFQHMLGHKIFK